MTHHAPHVESAERDRPELAEIIPAMIAAGVSVLAECEDDIFPWNPIAAEALVERILEASLAAARAAVDGSRAS